MCLAGSLLQRTEREDTVKDPPVTRVTLILPNTLTGLRTTSGRAPCPQLSTVSEPGARGTCTPATSSLLGLALGWWHLPPRRREGAQGPCGPRCAHHSLPQGPLLGAPRPLSCPTSLPTPTSTHCPGTGAGQVLWTHMSSALGTLQVSLSSGPLYTGLVYEGLGAPGWLSGLSVRLGLRS